MIKTGTNFKYRIKLIKEAGALPTHELRLKLQEILLDSKLPFEWTKSGPHLVLGPGEKQVNILNECQYADIYFKRDISKRLIEQELETLLNSVGYKILQIEQVPYNLCSVESLAKYVCYEASPVKLKGALPKEIVVQIDDKVVNLASFIKQIKEVEADKIEIITELSALRSVGIEQMLLKLPCLEVESTSLLLKRKALLWQDSTGAFRQI
jgi:hypothetical protein